MNIVFVEILDMSTLQGRKNCEIAYVKHRGNFEELMKEAYIRNISTRSVSYKTFREETEKTHRFLQKVLNIKK